MFCTIKPYLLLLSTLIIVGILSSCDENQTKPTITEGDGVYIVNEGNLTWGNASLSVYLPDSQIIQNNIFEIINDAPLGDVAQSMFCTDELAYIAINGSNKIYVMDLASKQFMGKITDLNSPRHIHITNEQKGFISDLYADEITIFDAVTFETTGSIPLGHSSENFLQVNNYLLVNSWSFDSLLFKIDINTNEIVDSLIVGFQPNSMVLDTDGKLWILCDGGYPGIPGGQKTPKLLKINSADFEIEKEFLFADLSESPIELTTNAAKNQLYFLNKGVCTMSIEAESLPLSPAIEEDGRNFYALGIHPISNEIYIGDAASYVQPGLVYRYDIDYALLGQFSVGINPGYFYFR